MTTDRPTRTARASLGCVLGLALLATACSATSTERVIALPVPPPATTISTSISPTVSAGGTGSPTATSPTGSGTTMPSTTLATTTTVALTGWDAFDQSLATVLDNGSIAVSATVLRDGVVEHEVALGSRTLAGDDPVGIGDRYRIASISKVITAITVLRLVQDGLIGLDDPVGARLSARTGVSVPAAMVDAITVRNLLTHRSGIGQYEDLVFRNQVASCPEAGAVALSQPLGRAPATTFRYSNVNFCLLGILIEEVTGRPYVDVATELVLAPLGIDGMRYAATFDSGEDRPVEHRSDPGRNYMEVLGAAGAWIASPTELAWIINSLDPETQGWKPLEQSLLDEMQAITFDPPPPPGTELPADTTPVVTDATGSIVPPPPRTSGYGMGLMIFGPESFGHTGTVESTHAMIARQPDGLTWAVTVSGDFPSSTRDLAVIVGTALAAGGIIGS